MGSIHGGRRFAASRRPALTIGGWYHRAAGETEDGVAFYDLIESPLGPIFIGGSATGLHRVEFLDDLRDEERERARLARDTGEDAARDAAAAGEAASQLHAYFRGDRLQFDLPLAPHGTFFQHQVWMALRGIPPGSTSTYGAIAARIGRPSASRAVGAANGQNPLAIVVPCHRVIGASGALTGYASGLDRKRWLLQHEGAAQPSFVAAAM